jgi:acyl carrier protein
MEEFVEPSVRRLVADHLGVGAEDLAAGVSLRDELAADSLDLLELAMALEAQFAIVVPERILDQVRTYGDLIEATGLLVRARLEIETRAVESPPRIWARIVPAPGESGGTLERSGWLDPYTAQTIAEDAMRAGRRTRLEVTVAASTTTDLARARHQFARLGERGVHVTVRRAPARQSAFTHRLLDRLTGTPTTVTLDEYVGDDPWQAEDLIECVGTRAKRFGDGTLAEQAEALSGSGPCRFVEGDPAWGRYRATTEGHHLHAHFDQSFDCAANPTRDLIQREPTRLDIGLGFAGNARCYQTDLCTEVRPSGELLTWREATCYARDPEGRAFDIASCMTRLTPAGHPPGHQHGLRAQFDLSAPSPNGFRPLTATLDGAGEGGVCTLLICVSAQIAGREQLAQVTLRRGAGSTMDVRLLPSIAGAEVGLAVAP